ncbi:DExH-box ATP-dependent RNA helicase DExH1, partial [Durusdinium trenchii]
MWFIPGKTETAQSKNKRQEDVTQAAEKEEEEEAEEEEEEEEEEKEKEEEEKKEADSEAKVQQKRLQQNQAEAELLQEAWKNLEDDRQLARAMAHDTLPKFWENLWDEAPDSIFKENAWEQLESRKAGHPEEELPIEGMRSKIVEHVRDHRATILVGATGCGKSTRLPQYIMDEPRASVLVTQPRRVAAVEIAKRVASERGEPVGQNVGYRISGETLVGSGKLQFATIGYVLTWFLANPEQFGKFSHIVIDEVHERGADMELFLLLTKLLMYLFPRPKVILMSATMQPDEFRSYYSDFAIGEPLSVPGRTFPVEELFLDDLLSEYSDSLPPSVLTLLEAAAEQFEQLSEDDLKSPSILPGLLELAVQLCPHFAQPDSTMLIFLPGLLELNKLSDLFSEVLNAMPRQTLQGLSSFKTFVLHSMVPRTEQEEVFKPPTGGRCHVVLASNIAESSLTLPRVTTVIDFGLHREPVFDAKQGLNCLCTTWCSHASVRQRSGRAGRTQPGVALRLFTRRIFEETMAEFDTPEILRTSLSRLFLRAKRLSEVLQKTAAKISAQCPLDLSSARALLGSLPQPPSAMLVRSAVRELANSGALAAPTEEADITSLGS